MLASNQQFAPALIPARTTPGRRRLAQCDIDAVGTPDRQHAHRVAAADVHHILVAEERA